jgi:N-acetylglucosaminyldiphosphoundecaprenol N-acetyl-beta-D-mannosaminyltransferase
LTSIPPWRRPVLFGCPVDAIDMTEAIAWVDDRIARGVPSRVGAVNAAKLVRIEEDPRLAEAVTSCELILADGMSVVWATRLLTGVRLRRVAGIDLMERLVEHAAEKGHRIFFLGAKSEVLETMIDILQKRYPTLQVAGRHHGYFKPDEEPALAETIRAARPDIVFVAMGTPAKEYWVDRWFRVTGASLSMGVGGSFDVIAGVVTRAPGWMQNAGLEWLYRLLHEPRRLWRRYLTTSAVFIGKVAVRTLKRPFSRVEIG